VSRKSKLSSKMRAPLQMGPFTVPDLVTEGSHFSSFKTLAEQHTCQENVLYIIFFIVVIERKNTELNVPYFYLYKKYKTMPDMSFNFSLKKKRTTKN
jgi:hypothetical protein